MISASIEANVEQQEMKEVMSVSFYKTYLEIQKFNHLILVGIPSSLILFEGGGFT